MAGSPASAQPLVTSECGQGQRTDRGWAVGRRLRVATQDLAAALLLSPQAAQAYGALGRTQEYAVILKLLSSRTGTARAAQMRRAISALEASSRS